MFFKSNALLELFSLGSTHVLNREEGGREGGKKRERTHRKSMLGDLLYISLKIHSIGLRLYSCGNSESWLPSTYRNLM